MTKTLILICPFLLVQSSTAQTCKDTIPASTPDSRFTIIGDEVTDIETGLIWRRCSLGQTGNDCSGGSATTYNWQQALQAADTEQSKTGLFWRLPNLNELESIVEEQCYAPAVNLVIFPNTTPSKYWLASPGTPGAPGSSYSAWHVDFDDGGSYDLDKSNYANIRLVRGGQ